MAHEDGRLTLLLGDDSLPLDEDHGFMVTELDLGSPTIREVVDDRPGQHGTDDRTTLFSSRAVSIKTALLPAAGESRSTILDRLTRYCVPDRRPTLLIEEHDRPPRMVDLRANGWSSPLTGATTTEAQASWAAPSGMIRSATPQTVDIPVLRTTPAVGVDWPITFDLAWPHAAPSGEIAIHNDGAMPAPWLIRIYGYCINPRVMIDGIGSLVEFGVGPVPAAAYWECNSIDRTVLENSMSSASRRNNLDFASTTWSPLPVGDSTITFTADTPSVPCRAQIEWYDQWLY